VRNATISLTVADELNAPPLAVLAMMVAAIGESDLTVVANRAGKRLLRRLPGDPANIVCDDTELQAESFLSGGLGFNGGGGIAPRRRAPRLDAGHIAFVVEGDISNFGGDEARAAAFYDVHRARPSASSPPGARAARSPTPAGAGDVLDRFIAEADRMISLHQPTSGAAGTAALTRTGRGTARAPSAGFCTTSACSTASPGQHAPDDLGPAGRGRDFTVWANMGHVFIIVESGPRKGQAWGTATRDLEGGPVADRYGTSHGTSGFVPRHFPGH
jgi:hypothetical protein